jgi:hypothetical protein
VEASTRPGGKRSAHAFLEKPLANTVRQGLFAFVRGAL